MTKETPKTRMLRLRVLYAGKRYDCRPNAFYLQQHPLQGLEDELAEFVKRRGDWLPPKVLTLLEEADDLLHDFRAKLGEVIDEYDDTGKDWLLTDQEEAVIWGKS